MFQETLKSVFGFDELRAGQSKIINSVMTGRSCAAIFPTGAGKSLCYQLPALHLPHLTLVISPLLALMKDQIEFLASKGVSAATIDSTQTTEEVRQVMSDVRSGKTKILMVSVERLKNERFKNFISSVPVSLLVVDEAHCISEWGHNFRPDYLKIPNIQKELNIHQVLLLTATATADVISDMQKKFNINQEDTVVTGFHRSNLDLSVIPCGESEKLSTLSSLVSTSPCEPTVVYVTLQKTAENIAEELVEIGINALPFHASLDIDVKAETQRKFMNGEVDCIVATIAFGMGIDKSDIRKVIHYDLPSSIEGYAQEIGRAGRDGLESKCILIGDKSGMTVLENFTYGDTPEYASIKHVIDDIYAKRTLWTTKLPTLSSQSNLRPLTLKTLLVYLELFGVISFKYSYSSAYRFKSVTPFDQLTANAPVFKKVLSSSKKARIWTSVDFEKLSVPRDEAVACLTQLQENGDIILEGSQIVEVFDLLNTSEPAEKLAERLHKAFAEKEDSDINRIKSMIAFFESDKCLTNQLANYFGDVNAPQQCGHCSVCRGDVAKLPDVKQPPISEIEMTCWVSELNSQANMSLTSIQLAKILCGMSSPLATRIKARSTSAFEQLKKHQFADVLEKVKLVNEL